MTAGLSRCDSEKVLAAARFATNERSPPLIKTAQVPVGVSGFFWYKHNTPSSLAHFSNIIIIMTKNLNNSN